MKNTNNNKLMKIGTPNDAKGLGDTLLLTGICRYKRDCIVELHPSCEKFSFFFNGICESINLTQTPTRTPHVGSGTFLERKMNACGIHNKKPLPLVILSKDEQKEAKQKIKNFKNPLIISVNCSKKWKHVREFDVEKWNKITDSLKDDYTLLQFGISDNFTKIDHTIPFVDLSLLEMCKYFFGVGKYLGVDTGDRHLAIALGCETTILHPNDHNNYRASNWHYSKDIINYVNFNEWESLLEK